MEIQGPVTVNITRIVKPGCEEPFEKELHEYIQRTLNLPGQLGVHVMKPAAGTSRDYGIVRKFASRAALDEYRKSREYLEWSEGARIYTEGDARLEELSGLESWFTLPGAKTMVPPPKYKMATLTLLGVYPSITLLSGLLGPHISVLPNWARGLLLNVILVPLLTWVIMPRLSRLFAGWLYPKEQAVRPNRASP